MTFNTYGDKGNLNGSLNVAYGLSLGGKILSRILERNEIAIGHAILDAAPLVLASPISFFIMLGYIPVIARRIKNEEKVLEDGLEGYAEYKKKVKYRTLPFIW